MHGEDLRVWIPDVEVIGRSEEEPDIYQLSRDAEVILYPIGKKAEFSERIENEDRTIEFIKDSSQFDKAYKESVLVREESLENGLEGRSYLHLRQNGSAVAQCKTILFSETGSFGLEIQCFDEVDISVLGLFIQKLGKSYVVSDSQGNT